MEDFFEIPEEELRHTSRALRRVLLKRGWNDVRVVRDEHMLYFATRPDGKKIRFETSTPSQMSLFAAKLANSKIASYFLLEQEGIKQPETIWLDEDEGKWAKQIEDFLTRHPLIVIKPNYGAHGFGVKTDISSLDEAIDAAHHCTDKARYDGVIMQEQLSDDAMEIRVICVDYKVVGAYERVPAKVAGDGEHNILELIEFENRELRGEAYKGKPTRIDVDEAKRYLENSGVDIRRVPAVGEKVRVMKVCNVGMGGTMRHVEISDEQAILAERIARIFDLPVIGVDFYGDEVIEVNASPALYCPTGDEWADECVERYVDYLEKI